jgi:hypothetical protein
MAGDTIVYDRMIGGDGIGGVVCICRLKQQISVVLEFLCLLNVIRIVDQRPLLLADRLRSLSAFKATRSNCSKTNPLRMFLENSSFCRINSRLMSMFRGCASAWLATRMTSNIPAPPRNHAILYFAILLVGYLAEITLNSLASKAFSVSVRTLPAAASAARHCSALVSSSALRIITPS